MIRAIAERMLVLATLVMPEPRRQWSHALIAEFAHIERPLDALSFASGAIVASFTERLYLQPISEVARLAIAGLFAGLALLHMSCAADGLRVALGGVDPLYLKLATTDARVAQDWREATLAVTLLWGLIGAANLIAAQFAFRNRRRPFLISLSIAACAALSMAALVFSLIGFTAGHRTFLAIIGIQTGAALLLWRFGMRRFLAR
jgi:hypothetical protein